MQPSPRDSPDPTTHRLTDASQHPSLFATNTYTHPALDTSTDIFRLTSPTKLSGIGDAVDGDGDSGGDSDSGEYSGREGESGHQLYFDE